MSENSRIEWTHSTFNTHWGCAEVSPGCDGCYAREFARRFGVTWGVDAARREFSDAHWAEPLKWNRKAGAAGERRRVFSNSMSDLFDKNAPAGVLRRHEAAKGSMPALIERAYQHLRPTWAPSTARQYRSAADRLKRYLVEFEPAQVKGMHVAAIKVRLAETPNMANRILSFLSTVFQLAVEWQLVASNHRLWIWLRPRLLVGQRFELSIAEERRNVDQNARLHALIGEIARQREWAGRKWDGEVWKRLLVSAWCRTHGASVIVVPALDGAGVDIVPLRTSKLTKAECSDLLAYVEAYAAEHGIETAA